MAEKYQQLYLLKQKAATHLSERKYSWAKVYLCDTLSLFQTLLEHIDDQKQMQKLIVEIKVPCHKNLSLCYLKEGNYVGCIEQCKEVLEIEPHSVKILYRLGSAHMNTNNLCEADKYLKQAFLIDPHEKQVMKALQRLEYLKNSTMNKQITKVKEGGLTIGAIIKFMIFWPIILLMFMYRKVFPSKNKTQ